MQPDPSDNSKPPQPDPSDNSKPPRFWPLRLHSTTQCYDYPCQNNSLQHPSTFHCRPTSSRLPMPSLSPPTPYLMTSPVSTPLARRRPESSPRFRNAPLSQSDNTSLACPYPSDFPAPAHLWSPPLDSPTPLGFLASQFSSTTLDPPAATHRDPFDCAALHPLLSCLAGSTFRLSPSRLRAPRVTSTFLFRWSSGRRVL